MIVELLLSAVKILVNGIIALFPTLPTVDLSFLDGVFQALSLADLLINISVVSACLVLLFLVMNIELCWSVIMWVVRKIPGVN